MLRPGGMMLYSTCTFDPSENEQTIEYLLGKNIRSLRFVRWQDMKALHPRECRK